jgi:hypothetical protein
MSDLKLVVPEATTNLVFNPSVEHNLAFYAAIGGSAIARVNTYQRRGIYSLQVTPTAALFDGACYDSVGLAAWNTYTFSLDALLPSGVDFRIYFADALGTVLGTPLEITGSGQWRRYAIAYTPVIDGGHLLCVSKLDEVSIEPFYLDGLQVEEKDYDTTYCDGDQLGCEWAGAAHGSLSLRGARERAGGRVRDFNDFGIQPILPHQGMGVAPIIHNIQGRPLADGAYLQSIKAKERSIVINCNTIQNGETDFEDQLSKMLQALSNFFDAFNPSYTPDETDPVILRWVGPSSTMEIPVNYKSGLEGAFNQSCVNEFALALMAYDPFWREIGNCAAALQAEQVVTIDPEAVFLIETKTGPYDMETPAVTAGGAEAGIVGMKQDPLDPNVYYAFGEFSAINDNPSAQGIVKFDKITGLWTDLDTGDWATVAGGSPYVRDIWIGDDGNVLAVGNFYGIDKNGDRFDAFAVWDGGGWTSFGSLTYLGNTADIRTVSIAHSFVYSIPVQAPEAGDIIVCGQMDSADGVGVAHLAHYSFLLGTWVNTGGGAGAITTVTAFDPLPGHFLSSGDDPYLYVFGNFTQMRGAIAVNNIARSDPVANWIDMNTGLGVGAAEWVYIVREAIDGTIYASGKFDTINGGGGPGFSVAEWNGAIWAALDEGVYADALKVGEAEIRGTIDFDDDGRVWFCGIEVGNASRGFLGAAVTETQSGTGVWNPATPAWELPTIRFTVAPIIGASAVTSLLFDESDDIVAASTFSFINNAEEVSADGPAQDDIIYPGTAHSAPILTIIRTGGTAAEIHSIQNATTGQLILFDHAMEDGEIITIDLKTMTAESSVYGPVNNIFDPENAAGTWVLLPGENDIRLFVQAEGGAIITAALQWRNLFWHLGGLESL